MRAYFTKQEPSSCRLQRVRVKNTYKYVPKMSTKRHAISINAFLGNRGNLPPSISSVEIPPIKFPLVISPNPSSRPFIGDINIHFYIRKHLYKETNPKKILQKFGQPSTRHYMSKIAQKTV